LTVRRRPRHTLAPGTPARTRQFPLVMEPFGTATSHMDVVIPAHPLPYRRVGGT